MFVTRKSSVSHRLGTGLLIRELEPKNFATADGLSGVKVKELRLAGAVKLNSEEASDSPRFVDTV